DAQAQAGAAVDETVTLTFNSDGVGVITPAVQASKTITPTGSTSTISFQASTPGTGGNSVQIAIDATTLNSIPVVIAGNLVTIYANWTGSLETVAQIAAHFPSAETADGGQIIVTGTTPGTAVGTTAAQNLAGGAPAITIPVTHSYTVSSTNAKGSGT